MAKYLLRCRGWGPSRCDIPLDGVLFPSMRSIPPALAPFFRSDAQGLILARILLSDEQQTLTEISSSASVPMTTVHREVERLAAAGVITSTKRGSVRFVEPNREYVLLEPLRQIVAMTYGPHHAVASVFSDLAGVERLYIFGSWAARLEGEPGPMPNDIDVLLVGDVDESEAYERAADADKATGMDVNPTFLSREAWGDDSNGFVATVKSRPLIEMAASKSEGGPELPDARHRTPRRI